MKMAKNAENKIIMTIPPAVIGDDDESFVLFCYVYNAAKPICELSISYSV